MKKIDKTFSLLITAMAILVALASTALSQTVQTSLPQRVGASSSSASVVLSSSED